MAFQKVEYELPDEKSKKPEIEVEGSDAVEIDLSGKAAKEPDPEPARTDDTNDDKLEIEVVDDTPEADRNRKASEPPADITDEELEEYSDKVRNRIKHFSKGYHDERREKDETIHFFFKFFCFKKNQQWMKLELMISNSKCSNCNET